MPSFLHPLRAPPLTCLSLTPGKGTPRREGLLPVLDESRGMIMCFNAGGRIWNCLRKGSGHVFSKAFWNLGREKGKIGKILGFRFREFLRDGND